MYHGIINIYKEKGFTSHDVVAVLRGILKQKKIGHTGTLDPEATGVLPVCLGKGTKVAGLLTDKDKTYSVTFKLGQNTDTEDHTGTVIDEKPWAHIGEEQVRDTLGTFVGDMEQVPPMYSAIKVGGKKLYELAREGKTIERKKRAVCIHRIDIVEIALPEISMTVHCSKGTYIRSLCRDIAEALGTCGHMTALERIASGMFGKESALTLDEVRALVADEALEGHITAIDQLFSRYEAIIIGEGYDKLLDNGNKMPRKSFNPSKEPVDGQRYNVYNGEKDYMGIYEWNADHGLLVPIRFFHLKKA